MALTDPSVIAVFVILVLMIAGLVTQVVKQGGEKRDTLLASMNILIDGQQRSNQAMMSAVNAISDANSKQAEVLSKYLDLFKTTGEPQRWAQDPEEENKAELKTLGFPQDGTDAEQAEWVIHNMQRL